MAESPPVADAGARQSGRPVVASSAGLQPDRRRVVAVTQVTAILAAISALSPTRNPPVMAFGRAFILPSKPAKWRSHRLMSAV